MKRFTKLIILLLISHLAYSADYSKVDKQAASAPANLCTAGEIAAHITRGLKSAEDKTRAIYYWMAHNIRYDVEAMNSNETYNNPQELVDEVLKKRKGLCGHYAELFHAMSKSVGVESYVIPGYTLTYGHFANLSHAWNAVRINSRFYLIDATWAAGHFLNGKYRQKFTDEYFMIIPAEFIKSHIPFDPMWQFLDNPVTHEEVKKKDFSRLGKPGNFNFADSIKLHNSLSKADKYMRENLRIRESGITNALIKEQVTYNAEYVASAKFNDAVELFNNAVADFNTYISSKNTQYKNVGLNKQKVRSMLDDSQKKLESSENLLNSLNTNHSGITEQIKGLKGNINEVKKHIKEENDFIDKYFKTPRNSR